MNNKKKSILDKIKPGIAVPCVCAVGVLTACFAAFTVGSQAKAPDPIPEAALKTTPCDMHFAATKNRCPQ